MSEPIATPMPMPSAEHQAAVASLLAARAANPPPPGVDGARAEFDERGALDLPPPGIAYSARAIGDVPIEEAVGASDLQRGRVLLYLHGGSFVMGSARAYRGLVGRLLVALGASRAVVPDYRLAPEHPHPAAADDVLSVYRGLLDGGVDPATVVVAGDSAGGNLALVLVLAARDTNVPLPAGAICMSPWTDLTMAGDASIGDPDPFFTYDAIGLMRHAYLAGADPARPLISPLFADLAGLPPIQIHVGTAEVVLDDSRRLAAAAKSAGVRVDLHEWSGLVHVFPYFAPLAPESARALEQMGAFAADVTAPSDRR